MKQNEEELLDQVRDAYAPILSDIALKKLILEEIKNMYLRETPLNGISKDVVIRCAFINVSKNYWPLNNRKKFNDFNTLNGEDFKNIMGNDAMFDKFLDDYMPFVVEYGLKLAIVKEVEEMYKTGECNDKSNPKFALHNALIKIADKHFPIS
jgi:hypothetical protein